MDTDMSNGPLAVKSGSHNQPLFDQYDSDGNWTGMLSDEDAATIDMSDVDYRTGRIDYDPQCSDVALFPVQHITGPAADAAELFHLSGCQTLYATPRTRRHMSIRSYVAKRSDGRLTIHAPAKFRRTGPAAILRSMPRNPAKIPPTPLQCRD